MKICYFKVAVTKIINLIHSFILSMGMIKEDNDVKFISGITKLTYINKLAEKVYDSIFFHPS